MKNKLECPRKTQNRVRSAPIDSRIDALKLVFLKIAHLETIAFNFRLIISDIVKIIIVL